MPATPEVIVSITRYTTSVLPADDANHKFYALHVELKPRGWIVTDGHQYYGPDGGIEFSQSTAHHFADYDDALALAKETAPLLNVNGRTATEVYQRTRPAHGGKPLPSPGDDATVEVLSGTIEQFFGEVDVDTFEYDDLAHTLLRALKRAGRIA
jgi:hypothetical protein